MENLYRGIWPEGANGKLAFNINGATVGNIMGEKGIDSRMLFKPIDKVSVKNTITTVKPLDPTMVAVAVALMEINKKLDGIQSSIDEVLRFLESDKQAKQRGNLRILEEIMEDFKRAETTRCRRFSGTRDKTLNSTKRESKRP